MHFLRHNRFALLIFFACAGLLAYLFYQAMLGPRSIEYRDELTKKLIKSQEMASTLISQRTDMEARVQMMRPESVDEDLADEFVRKATNMGKDGDLVVIFNR